MDMVFITVLLAWGVGVVTGRMFQFYIDYQKLR